jgi:Ca2+-binding RTX toxin-like protein
LFGMGGADRLIGGGGNDKLFGGNNTDSLSGGKGKDTLVGGKGADVLKGGDGADVFVFEKTSDSYKKDTDVIKDFSGAGKKGGDIIDLSEIDAIKGKIGNQAFDFGTSKGKGDLWAENVKGDTWIYGNVDGDKAAEIKFLFEDGKTKAGDYFESDFVL